MDLLTKALDASPLDERSKGQWSFALRQVTDALSPANNLMTNPEAQQLALETGGKSLTEGLKLFTEDLAKGRISMTDESAFEVGRNVATTPGTVIFQNELIQLIQYTPSTDEVYERPLVIVPPCINKFYILDLQPANSFVGHAVAEGHTVFLVSWRNAGPEQGQLTWDDYIYEGVLRAIDVALEITGADKANTLGFCVGGTLLASALAILQARGQQKAASMTLLTTLLDFSDTGEIGLLVDGKGVAPAGGGDRQGRRASGQRAGARSSPSLRANDLIWPYVVKGYLQGQAPPPFDLLYWNSDDTNLPGPMFCWYVRNTYLENKLREPGPPCRAECRSTSAPSTSRLSCTPRALTTSFPGSPPMPAPNCLVGTDVRTWRQRPHRRCDQSAGEEEAQLLGQHERRSVRRRPGSGSTPRRASPAAGGRSGTNGSPRPAARR